MCNTGNAILLKILQNRIYWNFFSEKFYFSKQNNKKTLPKCERIGSHPLDHHTQLPDKNSNWLLLFRIGMRSHWEPFSCPLHTQLLDKDTTGSCCSEQAGERIGSHPLVHYTLRYWSGRTQQSYKVSSFLLFWSRMNIRMAG